MYAKKKQSGFGYSQNLYRGGRAFIKLVNRLRVLKGNNSPNQAVYCRNIYMVQLYEISLYIAQIKLNKNSKWHKKVFDKI